MKKQYAIALSLIFLSITGLFAQDYTTFVNPFVGTQNMGHTFPGATSPFGMVQLSPETNQQAMFVDGKYNSETYRYCSGYQYEDSTIFGFSHTHFSGTGHSDLGDFLVMPTTGELNLEPGKVGEQGYHSSFSHETEIAEPGYYSVHLEDKNIEVELTSTERVGMHRYTFSEKEEAHIILDLIANIYQHEDKNVWSFLRVENDTLITGYRQTNGWARNKTVYFAMTFSKPIKSYGHKKYNASGYNGFWRKFDEEHNFPEMAGKNIRAYFNFDVAESEEILVKFALSPTSTKGALANLNAEINHWDFDLVKNQAREKWNKELSKIEVKSINKADKETFYTALYHTMLGPIIYEDLDGSYKGLDLNIHQSEEFDNYTIFSLWDTYRALHPLFNIIQVERNTNMIKSMMAHYDQSVHNMLPVWSHYANENWCMIGYHSVSVIADALAKGNINIDVNRALQASVNTSRQSYFDGLGDYMELNYVPEDRSGSSVSKTLEYAYNDWCIAQMAIASGKESLAAEYTLRSQNFENCYDPKIGFMRPKLADGSWKKEFNPMDTHGQGFIEGNAWNYGLYVPHQVDQMIEMMGGNETFVAHLDSLFTMEIADEYIANNEDITRDGIIGNYVQGNEPGHHIPYLYNWANAPEKTQERVRMIMETMYSNGRDGLCGNDDAGQMSAWYVFSAMGFYPVCPGSPDYAIGSPLVKEAKLNFENGNTLKIKAKNQSPENVFVTRVELNGKIVEGNTLNHFDLMKGGDLVFYMSNTAKTK